MSNTVLVLIGFAALLVAEEWQRPAAEVPPDWRRLGINWSLGLTNILLASLLPVAGIGAALLAASGPMHGWPLLPAFLAVLLVRSFSAYWLHRLFHKLPWLWRIHRVHHGDAHIDTSTGLRNHPIEALIVALTAGGIVFILAPPVAAVAAVDAVLFFVALWQHASIRLPAGLSRQLERLVITPRVHLLHHARAEQYHDTNFGDILPLWDRLFGTYSAPVAGSIAVGLDGEDAAANSLSAQLLAPLRR